MLWWPTNLDNLITSQTYNSCDHTQLGVWGKGGLGVKKVFVPDVDCTTDEFHEILFTCFPQLKNIGGFELLRCLPQFNSGFSHLQCATPPDC